MEDDGGTAATAEERTRYLLDTVRVHALIGGAERECSVSESGRVSTVDMRRLVAVRIARTVRLLQSTRCGSGRWLPSLVSPSCTSAQAHHRCSLVRCVYMLQHGVHHGECGRACRPCWCCVQASRTSFSVVPPVSSFAQPLLAELDRRKIDSVHVAYSNADPYTV